jgi:hypothetical protein
MVVQIKDRVIATGDCKAGYKYCQDSVRREAREVKINCPDRKLRDRIELDSEVPELAVAGITDDELMTMTNHVHRTIKGI